LQYALDHWYHSDMLSILSVLAFNTNTLGNWARSNVYLHHLTPLHALGIEPPRRLRCLARFLAGTLLDTFQRLCEWPAAYCNK